MADLYVNREPVFCGPHIVSRKRGHFYATPDNIVQPSNRLCTSALNSSSISSFVSP